MADPLSVAASIAGLLTAAASICKVLGPYVNAARDTPQIAHHVNAEVQAAAIILSALQSLAQNMASVSIQRAALVEVDQVIAVLTSGVFVFSSLEASVSTLPLPDSSSITRLALRSRFQWARKETEFTTLLGRLQSFKSSASLILEILQSDTSLRAEQRQAELTSSVNQLLDNDHDLSRRLMNLEDSFDAQTIMTKRRSIAGTIVSKAETERLLLPRKAGSSSAASSQTPNNPQAPLVSGFEFEVDLKTSGPYRRARRDTMDFSFCSSVARSHAWSVFSGLSLGDISVMSVVALPVYADEITNSRHYEFGGQRFSLQPLAETRTKALDDDSLLRRCLKIQVQLRQFPGFETLSASSFHPLKAIQGRLQQGTLLFSLCRCFEQFDLNMYDRHCHEHSTETGKPLDFWALKAISESSTFESAELPTVDQILSSELTSILKPINMIEKILSLERKEPALLVDVDMEVQNTIRDSICQAEDCFDFLLLDDFTRRSWKLIQPLVRLTSGELVDELGILNPTEWQAIFMPILSIVEAELNFLVEAEANLLQPPWNRHWGMFLGVWEPQIEDYGHIIGSQPRNSKLLRSLGDGADLPRTEAIAKALDYISLPSRLVEMKFEFLSVISSVKMGIRDVS
ncbi:uncharacterized protein B0H64DRAFT_411088 [Chaetomium fimeti]|uniref:Fungal N-terminal domain-containing protein n=1 Tax=Chaetomium fimeti TaxID=1854472 RepID=A0AAE0LML8_9PEZI|nr:hypothetical protein B0H64DRAFT_411088 [Chaetomium fimeti]